MQMWVAKAHSAYLDACVVGIGRNEEAASAQMRAQLFDYYVMHEIGNVQDAAYLEWVKLWVPCVYTQCVHV